jgi:phenylacetate-coenzyme A ligase PaaK-like adenylate-forming protein
MTIPYSGLDPIVHIKSNIGITVNVRVNPPGTVVRSTGKAQRVIDTRR